MNLRLCGAALMSAAILPISLYAEAPVTFESTPGKLPKAVLPLSYDIQLKPNIEKLTFTGSETVVLDVRKPAKTITFNVNTMTIASAKLLGANGKIEQDARVTIDPKEETATLTFDKEIRPGQHQISVEFAGKINEAPKGLYYTRYQEEGSRAKQLMLGTDMEPSDARRRVPCWDEPSCRATVKVTATVHEECNARSTLPLHRAQT